jgi:hypothetical protein
VQDLSPNLSDRIGQDSGKIFARQRLRGVLKSIPRETAKAP